MRAKLTASLPAGVEPVQTSGLTDFPTDQPHVYRANADGVYWTPDRLARRGLTNYGQLVGVVLVYDGSSDSDLVAAAVEWAAEQVPVRVVLAAVAQVPTPEDAETGLLFGVEPADAYTRRGRLTFPTRTLADAIDEFFADDTLISVAFE
jgi:hypothetical protein